MSVRNKGSSISLVFTIGNWVLWWYTCSSQNNNINTLICRYYKQCSKCRPVTYCWSFSIIISSPGPKAHRWAYSISVVVVNLFQKSPEKPLGKSKPNFIWSLLGKGERKFIWMVQVTWPRWLPRPYMVKTFKNLLQNEKTYDLWTWHVARWLKLYKVYTNDDPGLTFTLFDGKVKLGVLYVWMGKFFTKSFIRGKLAAKYYIDWIILLMKKLDPRGLSAPAPGLYTCVWLLFSNVFFSQTAWPIIAKFHVEPPWEGGPKVYINGPGHMTKMAATPIYGKNL